MSHLLVCHGLHELVQQLIVLLPTHTWMLQADVQGISEQLLEETASISSSVLV